MSSAALSSSPIHFGHLITIKLTSENYLFWRAQVLPLLRSNLLMGYVNGTNPCPDAMILVSPEGGSPTSTANLKHGAWIQQDQAILSAVVSSMTVEVLGMVLFASTSREAWTTLESSFASQSTARSMQIRTQLGALRKGDSSAAVFFNKVKSLSDTLTSIGQPLRSEEFTSYLLHGLDEEYDSLVEMVLGRDTPMPLRDLYARLLSTEQRLEGRRAIDIGNVHSANAIKFGGKYRSNTATPTPSRSNTSAPVKSIFSSKPATFGGASAPAGRNTGNRPICQLCDEAGHVASRCFKRFDKAFLGVGNDGRYTQRQLAMANVV